jgi:hypothetical protein
MTNNPKPKGKNAASKRDQQAANRKSANWILPAVLAVFVAGTVYWATQRETPETPPPASMAPSTMPMGTPSFMEPAATAETIPSYFASAEAARPYPATLPPEQFPNPIVARAYAVAREIPGTLAQQPCYCFCYRTAGHRGLLDCYADLHGAACSVCIQEALLAEKLQKEGRSAAQIREAIIRGDWRTVELN